jgi:hypothetical protein
MSLLNRTKDLNYGMFDGVRTEDQAKAARLLERIYHKGQDKAWDGKAELEAALERHGGIQLDPERASAICRLFAVIFWGELAAWQISGELAAKLVPLEAKLAATSQAHDEARHFYVMHDYLALLGHTPGPLSPAPAKLLGGIAHADSLAKKLLGMQLMVEPIALTLFHIIRKQKTEPVLCDLLELYIRDEARHVALGVQYLPELIAEMGPLELLDLYTWQLRAMKLQIQGLKEMEPDFRTLGVEAREVFRIGQGKQLAAVEEMQALLPSSLPVMEMLQRWAEFHLELDFPETDHEGTVKKWAHALECALRGAETVKADVAAERARKDTAA